MVYSLIQQRARLALKSADKPLVIYGKRKTFEPTGRGVLDLFTDEMVANVDGKRVFLANLKLSEHALCLFGFSGDVYLRWTPP